MFLAELLCDGTVKITSPKAVIAAYRHDLDHVVKAVHQRHIQSPAAEIEDQQSLILLSLPLSSGAPACQRGGGGFIYDPFHMKPRQSPRILGGLSRHIIKICRHTDDCFFDLRTQIPLRVLLQPAEHQCRELFRTILPAAESIGLFRPHKPFEQRGRVLRMGGQPFLRDLPDVYMPFLINTYDTRCQIFPQ